jgi:peroxiredoxin
MDFYNWINYKDMMTKNQILKVLFLTLIILTLISCRRKEIRCIIKGDVIGRDSKALILYKASGEYRQDHVIIPIIDHSFEYEINAAYPEVYELVFKEEYDRDSFFRYTFFIEEGEVKFTLYAEENRYDNVIEGNTLNTALNDYNKILFDKFWKVIDMYNDSLDLLEEQGDIHSEEWNNLKKELAITLDDKQKKKIFAEQRFLRNTGKEYINEAHGYFAVIDSLLNEMMYWEYNYISENTSMITYFLFMRDLQIHSAACCWKEGDTALMNATQHNFQKFSSRFPGHPYNAVVDDLLKGLKNIHEGGQFVDFSAPDMNAENKLLSAIIKNNKVILLDLWSVWCSPCIKKSNDMIPVYEEFKDLGFEIVGVARGNRNEVNLIEFIRERNYSWINLIDYSNEGRIWDKYGISNKGGGTFLLSPSGKIIGIGLSANEVRRKLKELLQ